MVSPIQVSEAGEAIYEYANNVQRMEPKFSKALDSIHEAFKPQLERMPKCSCERTTDGVGIAIAHRRFVVNARTTGSEGGVISLFEIVRKKQADRTYDWQVKCADWKMDRNGGYSEQDPHYPWRQVWVALSQALGVER